MHQRTYLLDFRFSNDNPTKLLKSQAPDVTVVVGSGAAAQEFQCYGVILSAASPVIDAMLGSGMKECEQKRIEFRIKIPMNGKSSYSALIPPVLSFITTWILRSVSITSQTIQFIARMLGHLSLGFMSYRWRSIWRDVMIL